MDNTGVVNQDRRRTELLMSVHAIDGPVVDDVILHL